MDSIKDQSFHHIVDNINVIDCHLCSAWSCCRHSNIFSPSNYGIITELGCNIRAKYNQVGVSGSDLYLCFSSHKDDASSL